MERELDLPDCGETNYVWTRDSGNDKKTGVRGGRIIDAEIFVGIMINKDGQDKKLACL